VGDLVWMDSKHTPNDVPYKLTARWFGPFKVLEVRPGYFGFTSIVWKNT